MILSKILNSTEYVKNLDEIKNLVNPYLQKIQFVCQEHILDSSELTSINLEDSSKVIILDL